MNLSVPGHGPCMELRITVGTVDPDAAQSCPDHGFQMIDGSRSDGRQYLCQSLTTRVPSNNLLAAAHLQVTNIIV